MDTRSRSAVARFLALCLLAAACGGSEPSGPALPEGAAVVARTPSLRALLASLARLGDTRLARRAAALAGTLPTCAVVEGRAPDAGLAEALEALRCREDTSAAPALGASDAVFTLALEAGGHLRGSIAAGTGGDVEIELALPDGAFHDARRLLVPGDEPAGAAVLSARDALVHARIRPQGGLDVASLVPDGGQAAQLFRLKSDLFSGIVLDGTWEAAIYLPEPGAASPPAALALGFRRRAPAVAAMESFVEELRRAWPVRRSFFAVGGAEGACLLDLNVLPELAPCYAATGSALVVGWNPASLRKALADEPESPFGARGGAVLELARFAEADARLAAGAAAATLPWPWRRIVAQRVPRDDGVRVRVRFESGA